MKMNKEAWNQAVKQFLKFIMKNKKRWTAAGLMLILGTGTILGSRFYTPSVQSAAAHEETVADAAAMDWTTAEVTTAVLETTAAEDNWEPMPGELNLAHYFPEGADQTDMTKSLAGEAFKSLMTHDVDWMSSIYDYSDITPSQMAKRLGRSASSVMGRYNPKDSLHDKADSSTWSINSFKQIRMTATDGDGNAITPYSNVLEIMSMANLYTFFKGVDDYDLFLSYCKELWSQSHSYTVSMSDVYYCSGCLSDDAEKEEMEALEAEAKAEALGLAVEKEDGSVVTAETSEASETSKTSETAESVATTGGVIVAGASRTQAETEETTTEAATEAVPESTSHIITSNYRENQTAAVTGSESNSVADTVEDTTTDIATETLPVETSEGTSTNAATASDAAPAEISSAAVTTAQEKEKAASAHSDCPGHVDLIIHMKIVGLKENKNLFEKDTIANDSKNMEDGGWQGWNQYTKASARLLSSQDWYTKYGLSVSSISSGNPLSDGEIEAYMAALPAGLSDVRKNIIRFALSSVGKVPYYWGGKPVSPNYSSNSFGILTTPDEKGRVLKGLDCSGWINWVYWSVTGNRLPYESTSGLAVLGTKVSRGELQPGDIIVRTGGDAHVIMFLGWTPDGQIRCIHESSASVNNVTVGVRDANWPYYRKLVE